MIGNFFVEAVIYLSYVLICAALFKRRFSKRTTAIVFGAAGIAIAGAQAAIALSGGSALMLTLLPLTVYLPFSAVLFFLSGSGIFETMAVCSIGTLDILILKSLRKTLTAPLAMNDTELAPETALSAVILIAAAGLVFVTFKFITKPFRFCVIENRQRYLSGSAGVSLFVPVIMIFLLTFYYLNSTTDTIALIFTTLVALSVFFIIARLLNSEAELMRAQRTEKELSEYIDIQRRGYDKVVRKMETAREYRHDMRHHLAVIDGLAKQGDCDKIIEYTRKLNGSFDEIKNTNYCQNPEINAILSEYISRAEREGCSMTRNLVLPESIPFEEKDVCLVLANALENAVNACAALPEEKRYINLSAEYIDGHKLLISVENPCANAPRFDEDGLPVTDKDPDEHGIGLRSVKRVAEKYNGFLRCILEDGVFVLRAALFYEKSTEKHSVNGEKTWSVQKRAASTMLGLVIGGIIVLNAMPHAADAASALLSIDIRTIRDLDIGWGSNSLDIQTPGFEGPGSDELNSVTKNYTDEAKSKFMWYFNRRYNGYVAEDMRYTVIRDDDKYFVVRFDVTVNAGGSVSYSRWIVYDKTAEKAMELSDLFKEGSDYIGVISAEIKDQMIFKNEHEAGGFFVEGNDAFKKIKKDVNFYIDTFDRLVIVFDEYEVAPGSMGSPEFYIPKRVLQEIAK